MIGKTTTLLLLCGIAVGLVSYRTISPLGKTQTRTIFDPLETQAQACERGLASGKGEVLPQGQSLADDRRIGKFPTGQIRTIPDPLEADRPQGQSLTDDRRIGKFPLGPIHTIIIDPGHGGFDPGCHGLISKEKNITLAISLKLGKALHEAYPGIRIVYTRTTDIMPGNKPTVKEGIRYRAELANREKGDLFICIHCNSTVQPAGSYPVKHLIRYKLVGRGHNRRSIPVYATTWVKNTVHGTTTYIWRADRNVKKGNAIDELRNGENMGDSTGDAYDMSSPEAMMRAQLYEKKYFANSALFGTLVEKEFAKAGRRSDGVEQRDIGIGVLEATGMPSVLIETGYLTNREEERYLASNKGQTEVARNIASAFRVYRDRLAQE